MALFETLDPGVSKALNKAVHYLSIRPRTSLEVKTFLLKKGFNDKCIQSVLGILEQDRYLDDRAFAKLFISSRIRNNPKSKFALGLELKNKGISPVLFDEFLEELDDHELALSAVSRKLETWTRTLDQEAVKTKIFNYLSYRGFTYEVIHGIWQGTMGE
ncbi:regulatory protein RecX [Desulfospira joergensenii]|uniref:regulatory protein RecX n=1 Tax=Desulfospira joergensenii TaxID=53329 RepID=UPI0003B31759|nr:regulatory protein RecX [Desulfospira joergensenii]